MNNVNQEACDVDSTAKPSPSQNFLWVEKMQSAVMLHITLISEAHKGVTDDEKQQLISFLCGKESVTTTLIKLCQLQQQLIKLALELRKFSPEAEEAPKELAEEDWEIIARAMEQRQPRKKEVKALLVSKSMKPRRPFFRSRWRG